MWPYLLILGTERKRERERERENVAVSADPRYPEKARESETARESYGLFFKKKIKAFEDPLNQGRMLGLMLQLKASFFAVVYSSFPFILDPLFPSFLALKPLAPGQSLTGLCLCLCL